MAEAIATLHKLGLTLLQSKVYVALISHGNLSISDLSKFSKVHRTDVYLVVKELEEKGLVERIIARPIMFRATPLKECINMLLQRQQIEYKEIRKEASKLSQSFRAQSIGKTTTSESKFLLIPSSRVIDEIRTSVDRTINSADLIITSTRFMGGVPAFFDNMKKSWGRGVEWRIAIHKKKENKAFWNWVDFVKKSKFCQIRFVFNPPLDVMAIYDQKEIFMIQKPEMDLSESPALWSNNQELIYIATDHFTRVWKKGKQHQSQ